MKPLNNLGNVLHHLRKRKRFAPQLQVMQLKGAELVLAPLTPAPAAEATPEPSPPPSEAA
jgi:hypothetical protein